MDSTNQNAVGRQTEAASESISAESRDSIRFRPSKVFLALPAYNEEQALPELLERIGEAFADSNLP